MGLLFGPRRALLGGIEVGIQWLLRDDFDDTRAAGSVDGTPATPGPGTRSVLDTGNNLEVTGGNAVINGRAANFDPGLWYDETFTRVYGRILLFNIRRGGTSNRLYFGADTNQIGAPSSSDLHWMSQVDNALKRYNTGGPTIAQPVPDTNYNIAIVFRTTGDYTFIKGGAFSNWTLIWSDNAEVADNLYVSFVVGTVFASGTHYCSFIRIPDALFDVPCLAYDTFTDANGTSLDAHSSDTSGPDNQAVTARSWTEVWGNYEIQSNRVTTDGVAPGAPGLIATIADTGEADVVIDCTMQGISWRSPALAADSRT